MSFNPITASEKIKNYYLRYIETAFFISDKTYFDQFSEKLANDSAFSKGPYLEATDSFKAGKSLDELIKEGTVSPLFRELDRKAMPVTRPLYAHQETSIKCIGKGENAVITTGTGSGKTESFLLPILNYLFRQQENGTLGAGVRALLIYPMNALANDQVKRLRKLLKGTAITFGAYTGETEKTQDKALAKYRKLNDNAEPLPNELISREVINETPPNLLITNYAMLEYLMIRPWDNSLFSGEYGMTWKFIVLDEAHTYTGATGIEVAMLLKRLKARLETDNTIQYILTSATLGTSERDNGEVIDFADTLCSVDNFKNENIIRSERVKLYSPENVCDFPKNMYSELYSCIESYNSNEILYEKACEFYPQLKIGDDIGETVFDLVSHDSRYYRIKEILTDNAVSVFDIMQKMNMKADEMCDFISLASKGMKNGVMLFDARYHYFLRTLEGAYLTIAPEKKLFIEPRKTYLDSKVFKFSVCRSCGEIYLTGYTAKGEDGLNYFSSECSVDPLSPKKSYMEYYLLDAGKFGIDKDMPPETIDENIISNTYTLCGKCGAIWRRFSAGPSVKKCSCGSQYCTSIIKAADKKYLKLNEFSNSVTVKKCLSCDSSANAGNVLRDFYMGQSAAASVIGTALYGEIPSSKNVIHTVKKALPEKDLFGFSAMQPQTIVKNETHKLAKQYLIFSDSRQEAAHFAVYFDITYHTLLRRRILLEVLKEHSAEYRGGVLPSVLCRHLEAAFSKYNIYVPDRRKEEALMTIMNEMVTDERNSLEKLGIISFRYKHKLGDLPVFPNGETNTVIEVLADGFRRKSAIKYETITDLSDDDKEFFQFSSAVQTIAPSKENQSEKFPSRSTWTSDRENICINYMTKLTEKMNGTPWDRGMINDFLLQLWENVFVRNESIETYDNVGYRMLIDEFMVYSAYSDDLETFVCTKCGRITAKNADGVCPEFRCKGTLMPFERSALDKNHYFRVYNELDISDLIVKEHTAQLDIEKAKEYQDKFVNKAINVLSCSTTFEMGVDVGDLETVFMKNMPPSPANYIQRAGRAGRRTDSAAYALTFCRLSSHDLNFYRYPEKMIKGHILPPSFKVTNEKIVQRHLNACCLSEFFRLVPESFSTVEGFVLSEYYGKFREFIESRPDGLMKILYDSIPYELHSKIEKWLDELVSDDGKLYEAYLQTVSEIEQLENYAKELVESGSPQDLKTASNVGYAVNTIKDTDILSFLSRKSILPKYGFPVDSVELFTSPASYGFQSTSKLRLSRDLAIAIAEYAPDSEIVADGKLYKSRYIKLPPRKNHALIEHTFAVCTNPECGCINTALNRSEIQGRCRICNSEVEEMGSYIIPQYGFVSEIRSKNATTKKPDRTYRGDVHYIGNSVGMTEEFTINDVDISVTKTKDDELLIMNRTPFYMCRSCGYAVRKKGGINEISRFSKEQHRTTEGRPCANKTFDKVYLGHELKTDVAIISISKKFEKDQALSVLYALLEGVSAYYSIERKDISGCLYYSRSGGNLHTVFVLYDTVPGGAGHVSRIASGSADGMKGVLKEAYKVVADCTCGGEDGNGACYSCLCNYENQRVHDRLNRGLAKKYLGEILSEN